MTDLIFLPDAPAIAGLTFRTFRGDDDYPVMVDIVNAHCAANHTGEIVTLDWLTNFYKNSSNFDPYRDLLFAEIDGRPIAYGRRWNRALDDGTRLYVNAGYILPEWARRGIGRAMLQQGERRLREIAATQPNTGPRYFQSFAADTEVGTEALLQSAGYQLVRNFFEMVRPDLADIPDLPLPAGLEVRPVMPDHYRAIGAALNEAFRDHWGFVERPFEADVQMLRHWTTEVGFDPTLWLIAVDGDKIAGISLNHAESDEDPKMGWVGSLGVLRDYRHKGLATALLHHSFGEFYRRGKHAVGLGVDAYNLTGALRLYERVGMHVHRKYNTYEKELRPGVELSTQELK